jgi:hypothetical protein
MIELMIALLLVGIIEGWCLLREENGPPQRVVTDVM